MAINIDPTTGTRDDSGILEYFYHENPPPLIESALPSLLDGSDNPDQSGFNSATPSQAQQMFQPEITLSPATPNKQPSNRMDTSQPEKNTRPEPQNSAAKMLNFN
jgi:penicillin-binding protein 1A